ncbi:YHYH protein [Winogradskyella psychrotolerans]|uniref:YHYH protein n=1 Tax=Winogradskyella psychrotolerans TaxID=1344585 RepID=UPI001C071A2B|nr:YHYH protein [Winogradskyella psychrotolerans]MBU2928920.1 YHYH protein [Winogradskyella psychrotolerans]
MKKLIVLLLITFFTTNLYAHEYGHESTMKVWQFTDLEKNLKADFIEKIEERVYLINEEHNVVIFNISEFTDQEQQYILSKANWINTINNSQETQELITINYSRILMYLGVFVILFGLFKLRRGNKKQIVAYSLIGMSLILVGCKSNVSSKGITMAPNNIAYLESIFGVFDKVNTRYDDTYFYIESDGIPAHEMMTGITNWQQQVPINHDYSGDNAWAIPLQPELAEQPLSTKDNFMKGAIAIGANGIPIFNPLNNRGEDANAIGELDKYGGHCGRADDYHYHLPPTHLQSQVGNNKPIAYALDGFPVYGETSEQLDENLGRFTSDSTYQYHAVKEYPYLIAAMKGKVKINPKTEAPENEIMPQAKTRGVRPDLRPLRDAEIIGFENPETNQYILKYKVDSSVYSINYGWDTNGNYNYEFINPDGTATHSSYKRK